MESYGKVMFGVLGILLLGFARTSMSASLREARQAANASELGPAAGLLAILGYLRCVSDNRIFFLHGNMHYVMHPITISNSSHEGFDDTVSVSAYSN